MMAVKKVLVVDDEIHIVHVVAIKLRNNGYEVLTAENGEQAYEIAAAEKPDLIVTDCQMPVMGGLEFVEKLRSDEELKNIPVIMLTARSFDIDEDLKQQLNISQCLSKPFSPKELLRDIEDVLFSKAANIQA